MINIGEYLEINSCKFDSKVAIREYCINDGNDTVQDITWKQLYEKSRNIACAIKRNSEIEDSVIGILSENTIEFAICLFGIILSGHKVLLINPKYSIDAIEKVVSRTKPEIIFFGESIIKTCFDLAIVHKDLKYISMENISNTWSTQIKEFRYGLSDADFDNIDNNYEKLIVLLCTSGTTNEPKICIHNCKSISAIVNYLYDKYINDDDKFLAKYSWCHIGGLDLLFASLLSANTTYIINGKFSSEKIFNIMCNERISLCNLPLPIVKDIFSILNKRKRKVDVSYFRLCKIGGQAAGSDFLNNWFKFLPNTELQYNYGMTEGGMVLLLKIIGNNEEVNLFDRLGWWNYKIDKNGELLIKGDCLFEGYYNNSEATNEAFDDGWYHTGDLAEFCDDDSVKIIGRKSDLIICGGENVNPYEVEKYLYDRLEIKEVVAVSIPDEKFDEQVAIVVELYNNSKVKLNDIEEVCESMPIHMRPKKIKISKIDKSSIGKVSRKQLSKKYFG